MNATLSLTPQFSERQRSFCENALEEIKTPAKAANFEKKHKKGYFPLMQ